MLLVGLTGGIAAGKSTVAQMLTERGAVVIDADEVAREVVQPGTDGLKRVVEEFSQSILNRDGSLNRELLGEIVFTSPEKRLRLEKIMHPMIQKRTTALIQQQTNPVVVYAVPLLIEAEVDYPFDLIVTVEADESERVERLVDSRGLTKEQALSRIAAQTSRSERASRADFVIENSGDLASLSENVDILWDLIQSKIRTGQ